jgi:hypothetical protein
MEGSHSSSGLVYPRRHGRPGVTDADIVWRTTRMVPQMPSPAANGGPLCAP